MAKIRIQKVMADNGLCSRRAAEQVIQEGRVKVNGHPVRLGDQMDPAKDLLFIDGERVQLQRKQEYHYLVLNKPRGFVTTTSDERGRKTVMDLVSDFPVRVFPACSRTDHQRGPCQGQRSPGQAGRQDGHQP